MDKVKWVCANCGRRYYQKHKKCYKCSGTKMLPISEATSLLKLYVWEDFASDYTKGLAFAIAYNEIEARDLIERKMGYRPSDWGTLRILELNDVVAYAVCGGG
jgi:predicted ATP-dependent serine protease